MATIQMTGRRRARLRQALTPRRLIPGLLIHLVARLFVLFMILPFLWMLSTAFKDRQTVRCAVNQEFADPSTVLRPGDEVAFFPPVTGG